MYHENKFEWAGLVVKCRNSYFIVKNWQFRNFIIINSSSSTMPSSLNSWDSATEESPCRQVATEIKQPLVYIHVLLWCRHLLADEKDRQIQSVRRLCHLCQVDSTNASHKYFTKTFNMYSWVAKATDCRVGRGVQRWEVRVWKTSCPVVYHGPCFITAGWVVTTKQFEHGDEGTHNT